MTEEINYSYVSMILFFCAEVSMLEPVEWQGQHEFFFCAEVCMIEPVEWQGLSIVYYIRYIIYIYIYKGTVKNLQWSGMWCKNKVYSLSHVSVSLPSYRLPSRTINCRKPKITPLKRKIIFPTSVFVFYLKFWERIYFSTKWYLDHLRTWSYPSEKRA